MAIINNRVQEVINYKARMSFKEIEQDSPVGQQTAHQGQDTFLFPPKILLVEDVPTLQTINMTFLRMIGCRVELARDGAEALRMVEAQYDLILLDIGLPTIDGFTVAQEIRKREKLIKARANILIALTSFGNVISKRCLEVGFNDFYVKPLSLEALTAVIKRWLPTHVNKNHQNLY